MRRSRVAADLEAEGNPANATIFMHDGLVVVTAPGNPKHVTVLAELVKPGVRVVLGRPGTLIGGVARQALAKSGVAVAHPSGANDAAGVIGAATFTFAPSAVLAARIRHGDKPDVIVADGPTLDALYTAGVRRRTRHRCQQLAVRTAREHPGGTEQVTGHVQRRDRHRHEAPHASEGVRLQPSRRRRFRRAVRTTTSAQHPRSPSGRASRHL